MKTSTHATIIIKCTIAAIAIASCAQAAPNDAEGVVQRLEKKNKELEETNRQLESVKHRQPTNKIEARMAKIVLPRISFKPPATLVDAVEFFRRASIDFDDPKLPEEQRGFNFSIQAVLDNGSVPVIPAIIAENINFLDALDLVLSSVGYKFVVHGSMVIVIPKNANYQPYKPRSYAKGPAKESQSDKRLRLESYKIEERMKKIVLPKIAFKPPATIVDAIEYFRYGSVEFGDPKLSKEERRLDFALGPGADVVPTAIPFLSASNISCWDALGLVCRGCGFKFEIRGSTIMVLSQDMTSQQLFTRSYKIPESALDKAFGTGNIKSLDEKNAKCLAWLRDKGVDWPENGTQKSAFVYVRAIECLRITNTAENIEKIEEQLKRLKILKAAGRK